MARWLSIAKTVEAVIALVRRPMESGVFALVAEVGAGGMFVRRRAIWGGTVGSRYRHAQGRNRCGCVVFPAEEAYVSVAVKSLCQMLYGRWTVWRYPVRSRGLLVDEGGCGRLSNR